MIYPLIERDSVLVEVLNEQGREGFSYKKHDVDDQQKALRLHSQYCWFYTVIIVKSKPMGRRRRGELRAKSCSRKRRGR